MRRAHLGMIMASLATTIGTMVELHKDNFDETIEANSEVLVHFLAPCMPLALKLCRPCSAK